ncbi:YbhB/YbcL family Raf kinase inhibitor-like protein [Microterricola pindariensis]|uniref:YbhB/YbcL family Raf kinase inhibitor-like protein n=1 Tax=Microterricola pindariensis TaxID=478010 RepID=A0ABX5AXK3_9MICO|nr:YbhB/YbcL family Raf kinase inhibitor-like protein [Microterricola pindariensis]PPL19651.1 hypothetical protein GY24_04855 [Microterricola pindariensis]
MFSYDPYAELATLKQFAPLTVTSEQLRDGQPLAPAQWGAGGGPGGAGSDTSPQLSWSAGPAGTLSYAVTCFDPDAPTGSGFWHWAVCNIPASVTSLAENAGAPGGVLLPAGSLTLPNERRLTSFVGAGPPPTTGVHRYIFAVHAVDVARLELDPQSTPAVLGFNLHFHTLARGTLTGTATTD